MAGGLQGIVPYVTIIGDYSDLETARCYHAVMVSQEHCCGRTFYRPDVLAAAQNTEGKSNNRTIGN